MVPVNRAAATALPAVLATKAGVCRGGIAPDPRHLTYPVLPPGEATATFLRTNPARAWMNAAESFRPGVIR